MGRLIFITGGVRSGKSAFAERYAQKLAEGRSLTYIASGVAFDREMQARIARHQADRQKSGVIWHTLEVPDTLPQGLQMLEHDAVILWDCLTTWLANVLYKAPHHIEEHIEMWKQYVATTQQQSMTLLLVSNEVLDEPASIYEETERYRQLLGELHQWIVESCDEAYEIDHQQSMRWK